MSTDAASRRILALVSLFAGAIVGLIIVFLVGEAWPALRDVGLRRFFTDPSWHPAGGVEAGSFRLAPVLVGSLAATAGAVLLATPLGLAAALFGSVYAPRGLATGFRLLVGLLAGIPSVVLGFWGLTVLAPLIGAWQPPGQSLLAAVLILTVMILPTIALLSEAALRAVPRDILHGAAALGLSRWATFRGVALPAARGGIFAAVLLGTGRAIGETLAVLLVSGNVVQVPHSVFDPMRTVTANIALELGYAMDHHRAALFVSGLLLLVMSALLVALAARAGGRAGHA